MRLLTAFLLIICLGSCATVKSATCVTAEATRRVARPSTLPYQISNLIWTLFCSEKEEEGKGKGQMRRKKPDQWNGSTFETPDSDE